MTDYYITEYGTRAHRRRDCPQLRDAAVNGVLTEETVEDRHDLRKCEDCRYTAPTLDDATGDLDPSMTVKEAARPR